MSRRQSEFLTTRQAAWRESVSVHTINRWCRSGVRGVLLASQFVGRRRLIRASDLDHFRSKAFPPNDPSAPLQMTFDFYAADLAAAIQERRGRS